MGSMHFGVWSVIGRSLLPAPAASRNAFTESTLRTTPSERMLAFACIEYSVEPLNALEPFRVGRHRVRRRPFRRPAEHAE